MITRNRQGARAQSRLGALLLGGVVALTGCDILDVSNPNNLVEEDIQSTQAANAVVNGAVALTARAISDIWEVYLIPSDQLTWIGSRDAWGALDQGFIANPDNEFADSAFPNVAQARWMADEATEIVQGHVDAGESQFTATLARGYLTAGAIYTVIGEVQQDFAFSDKLVAGAPVGPAAMLGVFDSAIQRLDQAVTLARSAGDGELETRALAMRARAKQSKAIRAKIQPSVNTAAPLVSDAGAVADAEAVLAMVGGTDWRWQYNFSASTVTNQMGSNINSRAENQVGSRYVETDPVAVKKITGIALMDPITGAPDREITRRVAENFVEGADYQPLTVVDERLMHLIVAEAALADGRTTEFADAINAIRVDLDGVDAYSGQISDMEMLMHERDVNTFLMGLRLTDMYRFGESDSLWQPPSDAVTAPGTLLPITITEIRSNCHLNGQTCPAG